MALVTNAAGILLSQLDLAKIQYAGIVEEAIDCLIALYLKNQEKFSEGKKKMQDAMKKSRRNTGGGAKNGNRNGTTSGKFRKPSADKNNCRNIDGSVMFHHKTTERWIPDRFPLGAKVTQEFVVVAHNCRRSSGSGQYCN
jgi:hypothetical protein